MRCCLFYLVDVDDRADGEFKSNQINYRIKVSTIRAEFEPINPGEHCQLIRLRNRQRMGGWQEDEMEQSPRPVVLVFN